MAHVEQQGGGPSQDFELNLAPIIDCLVVLIAFLMVSLSYLSIQMMDASVASAGGAVTQENKGKSLEVTVIGQDKIQWEVTQSGRRLQKGQSTLGSLDADLAVLSQSGAALLPVALIKGGADLKYETLIQSMDVLRNHSTDVQLGGF